MFFIVSNVFFIFFSRVRSEGRQERGRAIMEEIKVNKMERTEFKKKDWEEMMKRVEVGRKMELQKLVEKADEWITVEDLDTRVEAVVDDFFMEERLSKA